MDPSQLPASSNPPAPDQGAANAEWRTQTPFYRRIASRFGLQGKLVIAFMTLIALGLGASCWLFLQQSGTRIRDMLGEHALQLSGALALASKPALIARDDAELRRIGQDLLKHRNILFVGFLDAQGAPTVLASRDPDFKLAQLAGMETPTQALMQVRERGQGPGDGVFGPHLEVAAPVLTLVPLPVRHHAGIPDDLERPAAATQLVGYVILGVSQTREQAQLARINVFVVVIGFGITLMSLPTAYLLVRRIFYPIRQLVDATHRIAAGDLDAQVAIERSDHIGELARAFNDMVNHVKAQREALALANHDLEAKVEQRTCQLEYSNARLRREIAEKEDFLRAVSHDLNAPLRNISGMASMLLLKHRASLDDEVVHRLERIQKNVEMETDLIAELLELSRIKTRRQKMEMVDSAALVGEVRDVFDDDLRRRRIEFAIDGDLPVITCERARLRQVFQNLIDNAIKYMGEGPVRRIHLGSEVRSSEAEFYVRDTGMGIDPEDLDKVFYIFRRGKNSAAQNVSGKGVGLASVKSIVETYGGTIWVESVPGSGSTFRFTVNGMHVPMSQTLAARGNQPGGTRPAEASVTR